MSELGNVVALRPNAEHQPIAMQPCWTVPELAAYLQVSRRTGAPPAPRTASG